MKKFVFKTVGIAVAILLSFSGCSDEADTKSNNQETGTISAEVPGADFGIKASSKKEVTDADTFITLKETTAEIKGGGANLSGKDIIITKGGNYAVSGTLTNGRIVVKAGSGIVNVILNGADITSNYSSAFLVKKAAEVTLTSYEGSVNILKDALEYDYFDDYSDSEQLEPDACIYSEENLLIKGEGRLLVQGNNRNGVTSKAVLNIERANLTVSSVEHGITGKEALTLNNTVFNVISGRDGLRSNDAANYSVGTLTLSGSNGSVTSGEDGFQAESTLKIESGNYSIISGGGCEGEPTAETSAKAIKGALAVEINGGNITADSLDDCIHSNGNVKITKGTITLKSGDDALHADEDIEISGGTIYAEKSYEGMEATNVSLLGGEIKLNTADDGINISGGDGSGELGRPGMDTFGSSGGKLLVSGGSLTVNSEGDGLDANGDIEISGGTTIVNGPTRDGNGVLDFDGEFVISGGEFIAIGSSSMAQVPSESSSQNSLVYTDFSGNEKDLFSIASSNGSELITYGSPKAFNWVCYSSPKIKKGEGYVGYLGGSHSGKEDNGVYLKGKYTPGTKVAEVIAENTVSSNGSLNGGGFGRPEGGPGFGKPPRDFSGERPEGFPGERPGFRTFEE